MTHGSGSEPVALDRPWRTWASVVVLVILLSGVLLGVLIIPVVQGRGAGIDAYTAICRALGILPGSPALPQIVDRTPPTPVSQVVWTPAVLQNLAGQSGAAIYKQLIDYRTGSRTNQLMTDIAKALDETTLADVAAYYGAQPKRNANPATLAESPEAIVRLVELGDPNRNIPPCAACHRQGSGGPIETPILSEQGRDYLALQLRLYASGERRNDVYGRMRTIAAKLTPTEINGLATYYRAGFK